MSERSETEHPPVAPTGVRIVRADGVEIPCEVRFKGTVIADDSKPTHELLLPISNSSLQEHICSDGHPDWGDGTDCLNCGGGTKGTTN